MNQFNTSALTDASALLAGVHQQSLRLRTTLGAHLGAVVQEIGRWVEMPDLTGPGAADLSGGTWKPAAVVARQVVVFAEHGAPNLARSAGQDPTAVLALPYTRLALRPYQGHLDLYLGYEHHRSSTAWARVETLTDERYLALVALVLGFYQEAR